MYVLSLLCSVCVYVQCILCVCVCLYVHMYVCTLTCPDQILDSQDSHSNEITECMQKICGLFLLNTLCTNPPSNMKRSNTFVNGQTPIWPFVHVLHSRMCVCACIWMCTCVCTHGTCMHTCMVRKHTIAEL